MGDPISAALALNAFTLIHIFIGSLNLYLLSRVLGISPWAAVLAAVTFCSCMNTKIYAIWINITSPYAWLPLFILGLIQINRGSGLQGYILTTASLSLIILASPSQPLIHALALAAAMAAYWGYQFFVQKKRCGISAMFACGLALVTTVLMCTPVIAPTGLEMKDMIRWLGPHGSVIGNAPLSFEAFLLDEAPLSEWTRIFVDGPRTSLVGGSMIGLVPALLALLSLFRKSSRPLALSFGLLALYGLLSSFGTHSGLAYLNYQIPLINKIREPSRHLVLFTIAASTLTAIGASLIKEKIPRWAFGVFLLTAIVFHYSQMHPLYDAHPRIDQTDLQTPQNQAANKLIENLHSSQQKVLFKAHETALPSGFFGMNALYFRGDVSSVDGYFNPQRFSSHRRVLDLTPNLEHVLRLAGITHFICSNCPPASPDSVSGTFESYPYQVRELKGIRYPTVFESITKKKNPFILTSEDGALLPVASDTAKTQQLLDWPQNPAAVQTEVSNANYRRYRVRLEHPGLLAPDTLYSKNWSFQVNGKPVKSDGINVIRHSVRLPRGEHIVEASYRPRWLLSLFIFPSLGLSIFLLFIFAPRLRKLLQ
jgi:hypothetical protein